MLAPYAGYDPSERPFRGRYGVRFTPDQINEMVRLAKDGASSLEIGSALDLKPTAIRAKLASLGVRLRRRISRSRLRMVLDISKRTREAAEARSITPQQLIRRLLMTISRQCLFDQILGPPPRPHSLGACAVDERPTVVVLIRTPMLSGCTSPR